MLLLVPVFALSLGQFIDGNDLPRKVRRPAVIGEELLRWAEAAEDIGVKASFGRSVRDLPTVFKPVLRKRDDFVFICGGTGITSTYRPPLTAKQRARLKELYIQYAGSAAMLDPRIAKEIGLSEKQSKALQAKLEKRWPSPFGSSFFRSLNLLGKKTETADQALANQLKVADMMREVCLEKTSRDAQERELCREMLTPAQQKKLESMAGPRIGAALRQPHMCLAGASGPSSGPGFRKGLQADGAFAILRQDVAHKIGLTEKQADDISVSLEELYRQAFAEADEYWWLLKKEGSEPQIAQYRRAVFNRYEAQAQKMIQGALSPVQLAKWSSLVGSPIPGVSLRNHLNDPGSQATK